MWCDEAATALLEELKNEMLAKKPKNILGFLAQWTCEKSGSNSEEVRALNIRADEKVVGASSTQEQELCDIISEYQSVLAQRTCAVATNGEQNDRSQTGNEALLGMCNPLLDMVMSIEGPFLDKWGLKPDNAVLAKEETLPLFQEMARDDSVEYIPGGSGLNTMRVTQWLLGAPGSTVFIGTTGEDEFGNILHRTTATEGVEMLRLNVEKEQTGTCAVLTCNDSRSLVANLGASGVFKPEWLTKNSELCKTINSAGLYYITGFFLRTSPETVRRVVDIAHSRKKAVCINLSAPFVCSGVGSLFDEMFPHTELVFGNKSEYLALEEALDWKLEGDSEAILTKIASAIPSKGSLVTRHVIMTQGGDDVLVASRTENKETEVRCFPTPDVPQSEVVDTNGAGDAFVGGFLAKYSKQGSISECVKVGQWAASIIIRRPGCTIPPLPPGCLVTTGTQLADTRPAISRNKIPKQKAPPTSFRKLKRVRSTKHHDPAK